MFFLNFKIFYNFKLLDRKILDKRYRTELKNISLKITKYGKATKKKQK